MPAGDLYARVREAVTGTLELMSIRLGRHLGLYDALAAEPATASELAERTGTNARMVREWLEHQAVTGFLELVGGSVIIADERVPERLEVPGSAFDRYIYGWSVMNCLPAAMTDPDSANTGAVMRPDTLRRHATAAGFSELEILPIDHFEWRFYRLLP